MTQTVVALFDTTEAAERAAYDLATQVGGVRGEVYAASRARELSSLAIPGEDSAVLHENIRRGGAVLHAEVPDDKVHAVADALEAAGAVDFDEREAGWRREGWTGEAADTIPADAATVGTATAGTGATGGTTIGTATAGTAVGGTAAGATGATAGTARQVGTGTEEVIPVVEERLRVGKRETSHGRVRIRSYVVETPVQEQVTLREEHVRVERRPVDRPVGAGDDALFRDRTIEATETAEEAVIAKEARIKEEVVIRKEADERTETVQDKVRRTEVEVEDERGRKATPDRRDRT